MKHVQRYVLDPGVASPLSPRTPILLRVDSGLLWLTVENDQRDYWLQSGQTLTLEAGVRAWLSADRASATVECLSMRAREPHAPLGALLRRLRWITATCLPRA